jgi:hypothetical protein
LGAALICSYEQQCTIHNCCSIKHCSHKNVMTLQESTKNVMWMV